MHAMKCNLSNYSKFSYCYLGEMHLLGKFYFSSFENQGVTESRPDLGCCIPLCGFLIVLQLVRYRGHKAE
jgi:hypothetical protein